MDRRLKVSSDLLLSFPELQSEFYEWMDQMPAVRWHPWLLFAIDLAFPLKCLHHDGCGWPHVLARLPLMILASVRVALELCGRSKQAQSLASVIKMACQMVVAIMLMACGDPCFASLGPSVTSSPATAAAIAAGSTAIIHLSTPYTIQHLPLVCWITGPSVALCTYMHYMRGTAGGLMSKDSDPYSLGFFCITISTLASMTLAFCLRVYLAKYVIESFLQSKRPRRGDLKPPRVIDTGTESSSSSSSSTPR